MRMRLNSSSNTLNALQGHLNASQPYITSNWRKLVKAEAKLITPDLAKELMLTRRVPKALDDRMAKMEADFIEDTLQPVWTRGLRLGGRTLDQGIHRERRKSWDEDGEYEASSDQVAMWKDNRKEKLKDDWKRTRDILLTMLAASLLIGRDVTFESVARQIVAAIGLTPQQYTWASNRQDMVMRALLEEGKTLEEAQAAAMREYIVYTNYLKEYRARMIANTEASAAFHGGQLSAIYEAQENGWIGHTVKVWTAFDGCCDECGELDGEVVELEESYSHSRFDGSNEYTIGLTPPLHPNCRCTLSYETRE